MAVKKQASRKWFVDICEGEVELHVLPDADYVIRHIKTNGPVEVGEVELNQKDHDYCKRAFKKKDVAIVVLGGNAWNRYGKQLGLSKLP